jgi:hypothetical protein
MDFGTLNKNSAISLYTDVIRVLKQYNVIMERNYHSIIIEYDFNFELLVPKKFIMYNNVYARKFSFTRSSLK